MKVISKTENQIVIQDQIGIPFFITSVFIFLSGVVALGYKFSSGSFADGFFNKPGWIVWFLWIGLSLIVTISVEISEILEADKTSGVLRVRIRRLMFIKERACKISDIDHIGLGVIPGGGRFGDTMHARPEARMKGGAIFVILTGYRGAGRYNPLYTPLREVKFSASCWARLPAIQELADFLGVSLSCDQIY